MRSIHLLRQAHVLLYCLIVAFVLQGCINVKCEDCGAKCPDGLITTMKCKDGSTPKDGKCPGGAAPIIGQACMKRSASCGFTCYFEGRTGCDPSNPSAKCSTVTNPDGSCDCKCL